MQDRCVSQCVGKRVNEKGGNKRVKKQETDRDRDI